MAIFTNTFPNEVVEDFPAVKTNSSAASFLSDSESSSKRQTEEWFHKGNYAAAAMYGDRAQWQTYAAMGLVGKTREALEGLSRFAGEEVQFYRAATVWIDGDDQQAAALLAGNSLPHAQRLLELVRKPCIEVLAQWSWCRRGCANLLTTAGADKKFQVRNISFHSDDLPNQPYADVYSYYDPENPPDFYSASMVEWHLLPSNLQQLPCPIFGQTGDYDLHIQTVQPWLQLFDEVLVTDPSEWRDVHRLVQAPTVTFPKSFGVPDTLPPMPDRDVRPLDLFLSGTLLHPYHPDKGRLIHQIMRIPDLNMELLNGFVSDVSEYFPKLAGAKLCVSYVRHPAALPTRGIEGLAMGCALLVQQESVLRLFAGENEGVVSYDLEAGDLASAVGKILQNWPEFEQRARRGAEFIRREFSLTRVASQYLRFLTFLAAKPRPPRRCQPTDELYQKRPILQKGWLPEYDFRHGLVLQQMAVRNHGRIQTAMQEGPLSSRLFIDAAREAVLFNHHRARAGRIAVEDWLTSVRTIYRQGMERFPDSLALRFCFIRVLLHFGSPKMASQALELLDEALARPTDEWTVDPLEDVFPWDFFPQFFNYREYFDQVTKHFTRGESVEASLIRLMSASLHFYRGLYAPYEGFYYGGLEDFQQAVRLDPEFPYYKLYCARRLVERGKPQDDVQAVPLLTDLTQNSILFLAAFPLLKRLRPAYFYYSDDHMAADGADFSLAALRRLERVIQKARNCLTMQEKINVPSLRPDIVHAAEAEVQRRVRHQRRRYRRCRAEMKHAQKEWKRAHLQVERYQQYIATMESSKFWKLRAAWMKIKKIIRG